MSRDKLVRNRSEAFFQQQGRCYYCGALMWANDCAQFALTFGISPRAAKWLQCTAEHLHSRRDGGTDARNNIVAACLLCNRRRHNRKGSLSPAEYLAHVRARLWRGTWHVVQILKSGLVPTSVSNGATARRLSS